MGLFACFCFSLHVNQAWTNDSGTSANGLFPVTQIVEMVHEQLSEYPIDVLQAAGHQLDNLILSCTYDTDECL